MQNDYVALIPAYKPDSTLIGLLSQLYAEGFKIIVVDDGSGEEFSHLFQNASEYATLLVHTINKGKGSALKTGFSYIQKNFNEHTIIVTVDADGQHCPKDAVNLCDVASQNPDALILGSRTLEKNVPLRSRFGNAITRFVYRISTGCNVHDTQTGLRALHINLLPELLSIPGERYEYEMHVLLEFARRHISILETEIETIYRNNNATSHFKPLRDSYLVYKEIFKFSAASLIGFLVDYIVFTLLSFNPNIGLRFSNIGARIVSASVNYTLNRKFVFHSKNNLIKSALQYVLLAALILFGNTIVLEMLVAMVGFHPWVAKILTEILFFFFSWTMQRFIIFKKNNIRR